MEKIKKNSSIKKILALTLAFMMVFTGLGIGQWGLEDAWAANYDCTIKLGISGITVTDGYSIKEITTPENLIINCQTSSNDTTGTNAQVLKTYFISIPPGKTFWALSDTGSVIKNYHNHLLAGGKGAVQATTTGGTFKSDGTAFQNYSVTTSDLTEKGYLSEEFVTAEDATYYYAFIRTDTKKNDLRYALLIEATPVPVTINTDKLNAVLKNAPSLETDTAYYHTDDRYNGKTTITDLVDGLRNDATIKADSDTLKAFYQYNSWTHVVEKRVESFWELYEAAMTRVDTIYPVGDNGTRALAAGVKQNQVDAAAALLEAAIANLIPTTQVNPTELYEVLNARYRWMTIDNKIGKIDVSYSGEDIVTENTTTALTWAPYAKALKEGQDYLNSLYKNGEPTEKNKVSETDKSAQEKCDALSKAIAVAVYKDGIFSDKTDSAAASAMVKKSTYEDHYNNHYLPYLEEARIFIEEYSPEALGNNQDGTYTADSWDSYVAEYNAFKEKCEYTIKTSPGNKIGGSKEDFNTVFYFDTALENFKAAVNGLVSNQNITVSFEYINNAYSLSEKATITGTGIHMKKEFGLEAGSTTISSLVTKAGLQFQTNDIWITPATGYSQVAVQDEGNSWFMVYINDEFRGIYALNDMNKIQLHNGEDVRVVKCLYGIGRYEYAADNGGTTVAYASVKTLNILGDYIGAISITKSPVEAVVGEKTTIAGSVKGTYFTNQDEVMSAEGLTLFVSEPSENKTEIADTMKKTNSVTDADGRTEYIFREPGWYIIALYDTNEDTYYHESYNEVIEKGDYHGMRAAGYASVHVTAAEDETALIEESRKSNLAEAKAFYEQYHDYDFTDSNYAGFVEKYNTLVTNQKKEGLTYAELMNSFDTDYAALKKASATALNHELRVSNIRSSLENLPDETTEVTYAHKRLIEFFQNSYGYLNEYEKTKLFSSVEIAKNEMYAAFDVASIEMPQTKTISVEEDTLVQGTHNSAVINSSTGENVAGWVWFNKVTEKNIGIFDTVKTNGVSSGNSGDIANLRSITAYAGNEITLRRLVTQNEGQYWVKYSLDGGENWELAEKTGYNEYSEIWISIDFTMPNIEADSMTIQLAPMSKAEYEEATREQVAQELQEAKQSAKDAVDSAFSKYKQEDYSNENWTVLASAHVGGLNAVELAATVEAVSEARRNALAAMAAVKTKTQEENNEKETGGASGVALPDYGKVVGKVHIIVENQTFKTAGSNGAPAWYGTLIDGSYDLCENDTMMTAVLKALQLKGCNWSTGSQGVASSWDDYSISYIASIKVPENVQADGDFHVNDYTQRLGEFSGESGSGWMGTLNDWFTNYGFNEFSYKNGELEDGDEIHIMFTQNLGEDLGGTWGNSDTSLKSLSISKGKLMPSFDSSTLNYGLILGSSSANLMVSPAASNKNYQVRTYLNKYNNDSALYRRTSIVPVKAGDTLYVGCGEYSWPSMNNQGAEARAYTGTKYTIKVYETELDYVKDALETMVSADAITYTTYKKYKEEVASVRKVYNLLSSTDRAKLDSKLVEKLAAAENQIQFYSDIDDAKDKFAALKSTSSESAARAAYNAYNKLNDEQKKYITVADTEVYNQLAEKYKMTAIAGSEQMPESNVTTDKKDTTAVVEPVISEGAASVTVDKDTLAEIKKHALEAKSDDIIIQVSKDVKGQQANSVTVNVDVSTLKDIAKSQDVALTVSTEAGTVKLDSASLKDALTQARGSELTIIIEKKNTTDSEKKLLGDTAARVDLTVKSGAQTITKFAGKVTVTLEIPSQLLDKKVAAVHIESADKFNQMQGSRKTIGNTAYYVFETEHFSSFALVDGEALGLEVNDEEANIERIKELVSDMSLKARSSKTSKKNIKVTLTVDDDTAAAIKEIKSMGYTVKYKYYRSTRKDSKYQARITKTTKSFINTAGKKGTKYYYKARIQIYDKDGNLVAQTLLTQCKYSVRTWTK